MFLRAIGSRQREGMGCWAHLSAMLLGLGRSGTALSMKTEKTLACDASVCVLKGWREAAGVR